MLYVVNRFLGTKERVEACKRLFTELADKLKIDEAERILKVHEAERDRVGGKINVKKIVTEWQEVPIDAVSFVIGKRARNIMGINWRTGARAMIDNGFWADGMRRFNVTGTGEQVTKCREKIRDLVEVWRKNKKWKSYFPLGCALDQNMCVLNRNVNVLLIW